MNRKLRDNETLPIRAMEIRHGELYFTDSGCGCCSDQNRYSKRAGLAELDALEEILRNWRKEIEELDS